jgi:hypothetical protein
MAKLKPRLQKLESDPMLGGSAEGVDAGQAARNRACARLSDAEMYVLTEAGAAAAFSGQVLTAEQVEALDKFWATVDEEMAI